MLCFACSFRIFFLDYSIWNSSQPQGHFLCQGSTFFCKGSENTSSYAGYVVPVVTTKHTSILENIQTDVYGWHNITDSERPRIHTRLKIGVTPILAICLTVDQVWKTILSWQVTQSQAVFSSWFTGYRLEFSVLHYFTHLLYIACFQNFLMCCCFWELSGYRTVLAPFIHVFN